MPDLSFQDWQTLLANYGRAYAFGQIVSVQDDTPVVGQATLTVSTRMRPNQWAGAGFVVYTRGGDPFNHWWQIQSNSESQIVVDPSAAHYVVSELAEGDSFAIMDFNTITSLLASGVAANVTIVGRDALTADVATNADISGGVASGLPNFTRFTVYIKASAAINIIVELSPDSGVTFYELPESPISFSGVGDEIIVVDYQADVIGFTGDSADPVTIQIRGSF